MTLPPQAAATEQQPAAATGAGTAFQCTACSQVFASAEEQRVHCKSERHVYNTKRRLAGLKPISQELWERKLRESSSAAGDSRGTAHLKTGKTKELHRGAGGGSQANGAPPEEELPWTTECCLFDRKRFGNVDDCLGYMWRTYNFAVPDREYCVDLPGLLGYLNEKISVGNLCLYCHRKFPDAASVRRHMLDKNHTRIGTDALSRRGRKDELGSEEMQDELQDFFDFTSSTREVTERIVSPQQKAASLVRFFDADRDGFLDQEELGQLWAAVNNGAELSEAQYTGACSMAGADPEEGIDAEALGALYAGGLADIDAHFAVLQELLMRKLGRRRRKGGMNGLADKSKERERENEETEDEEEDEGGEDGTDEEDGDDDDGEASESDTEVLECEDEDEFREVMRVLGLQPATLMDNGDLRLPNGHVAVHREVAHIWKQRGTRVGQLALPGASPNGRAGAAKRTPLMLTNGVCKVAMSHREQKREGKKIVAVLREEQKQRMKLGMAQNILQKKKPQKFRTIAGDMSGGH